MSTQPQEHAAFPDYEEFAENLLTLGVYDAPSHTHGLLCGLIMSTGGIETQEWLKALSPVKLAWNELTEEQRELLTQLIEATLDEFRDPESKFTLFLPDDDELLEDRVRAFGLWCEGIINGLTLSGNYVKLPDSPQVLEMLDDLKQMSEVDDSVDEEEEQEKAFFELQEYVKVAVLLLQQEFASYRGTVKQTDGALH